MPVIIGTIISYRKTVESLPVPLYYQVSAFYCIKKEFRISLRETLQLEEWHEICAKVVNYSLMWFKGRKAEKLKHREVEARIRRFEVFSKQQENKIKTIDKFIDCYKQEHYVYSSCTCELMIYRIVSEFWKIT